MKLDSRILKGKKPLNCFETEQAKQFIGKECYLSDEVASFANIDNLNKATLKGVDDGHMRPYKLETTRRHYGAWSPFILPCEWVKEPEKKYRVLTLNEFLERFKIGDAIYIRFKKDGAERVVVFSEYNIPPHKDEGNNTESVCLNGIEHHLKSIVCLSMREYKLTTLFENYEYFDGKEWKPFGIEVEEK